MANKKNSAQNGMVVVPGEGIGNLSMMFADLVDEEEAIALAKYIVALTGQTVTVRDDRGNVLDKIPGTTRN